MMREITRQMKTVFQGRLLRVDAVEVELENGRRAGREIVRHPGAAVILAQLPDDRFVLVRQYRKAVEQELLEVVAGTLHPGENPDDCARRELKEETGFDAVMWIKLGEVYPAPGYTDERLHIYYARLDGRAGALNQDEDEKLEPVFLTALQLDGLISRGEIHDAKTLAAWMLYHRRMAGKEPSKAGS